jgi:hypothetical protein
MKGRLIIRIRIDSGRWKTADSSIETPVTPPSIKWLDSKKDFSPNAAENTPAMMKSAFFSSELGRLIVEATGSISRGIENVGKAKERHAGLADASLLRK